MVFVFRRNRGIFLKYLNLENMESFNYVIDCPNPFLLHDITQLKEKLLFHWTLGRNTALDLEALDYFNM